MHQAEVEQTFPKTQDMLQKNTGEGVRQAPGRSGADLSKDTRHATEKDREVKQGDRREAEVKKTFQKKQDMLQKKMGVRQVQCRSEADLSKETRHAKKTG